MEVRIDNVPVSSMEGVVLRCNGDELYVGSWGTDFEAGEVLEIENVPPLAPGDAITVFYKPTDQTLLETTVPS